MDQCSVRSDRRRPVILAWWMGRAFKDDRVPGSGRLHNGSNQRYLYKKAVIGNRVQGIAEKDCNVYCNCRVFFHPRINREYNPIKRSCDHVLYL